MKTEQLKRLGKRAFVQSIKPYKGGVYERVEVFGFDTEYIPYDEKASKLVSWQLAGDHGTALFTKALTKNALCVEAWKMLRGKTPSLVVFVTFFAVAEIQFFDLKEWLISEFKGKYRLESRYKDVKVLVCDLSDWYQHQPLAKVAKQWGLEKLDFDIGEKVEAIKRGEATVKELVNDPAFRRYAMNDAEITQRIFKRLRSFFLDRFDVDICTTLTPANTSACIMRKSVVEPIGQRNTELRELALRCCWGGRMECLFRGEKPLVYEYDATGHHPSSALALKVLPLEKDWKKTSRLSVWLSGISGIGKVAFRFPQGTRYPCLPVMAKDALLFPLSGVAYCTVPEVRLAKEMGASVFLLSSGFYFKAGSDLLQKHLILLQTMRNTSADAAERELLKLQSNGVIGKFFQKNIGVDLGKVQAFALANNIPVEEAIKVKGEDFGGEAKVGSCFYPEWYACILGFARASIASAASRFEALVISSDSFVTDKEVASPFTHMGISFSLKASGTYVGYRTRFYRVGEKLAHHAVHSRTAGAEVLESFRKGVFEYEASRFIHLRESWRLRLPFGSRTVRHMTTDLGFDYKRKLLENGDTEAWGSLEERNAFLEGENT